MIRSLRILKIAKMIRIMNNHWLKDKNRSKKRASRRTRLTRIRNQSLTKSDFELFIWVFENLLEILYLFKKF